MARRGDRPLDTQHRPDLQGGPKVHMNKRITIEIEWKLLNTTNQGGPEVRAGESGAFLAGTGDRTHPLGLEPWLPCTRLSGPQLSHL